MKNKICKICGNVVDREKDAIFDFPILPDWHDLFQYSGSPLHVECVNFVNKEMSISKTLADMHQDVLKAKDDFFSPFLLRDGNIIIMIRLDMMGRSEIEIYDYEDFVILSVLCKEIENLNKMQQKESMTHKYQTLERQDNDLLKIKLSYYTFGYEIVLKYLNYERFMEILNNKIIMETVEGFEKNMEEKLKKRKRKKR